MFDTYQSYEGKNGNSQYSKLNRSVVKSHILFLIFLISIELAGPLVICLISFVFFSLTFLSCIAFVCMCCHLQLYLRPNQPHCIFPNGMMLDCGSCVSDVISMEYYCSKKPMMVIQDIIVRCYPFPTRW
jgi:hypothetical protein